MDNSRRVESIVSLPAELWLQVFFQHTEPEQLWTIGRRVCRTWHTEIPKVFAKKYLEDPDMVLICFRLKFLPSDIEMVFHRYDEEDKSRCIFVEHATTIWPNPSPNEEKNNKWKTGLDIYLGSLFGEPAFDLPPYQIRIKTRANATELPDLQYDFEKREISFLWSQMFDSFFREAAEIKRRQLENQDTFLDWLYAGHSYSPAALALQDRDQTARRRIRRQIRRERIIRWYRKNNLKYYYKLNEPSDQGDEFVALEPMDFFEMHGNFVRCAEHADEMRAAKKRYDAVGEFYSKVTFEDVRALQDQLSEEEDEKMISRRMKKNGRRPKRRRVHV